MTTILPYPPAHYVYVLSRPDGRPFYVGKGRGRRMFDHDAEARSGCPCHKCRVIRKIWRQGAEIQREVVFESDSHAIALGREIELIAFYGRAALTNQTAGGEGVHDPSPEIRAKLSKAARDPARLARAVAQLQQWNQTDEARAQRHQHIISEEGRQRIGAANRVRVESEETRARRQRASRGRTHSPETRQKIAAAAQGRAVSAETRAKVGAASRLRGIPRDVVDRARAANTGRARRPETIEKLRNAAFHQDATWRDGQRRQLLAREAAKRATNPAYALMEELLSQGATVREVRACTGISERTVYHRRTALLARMAKAALLLPEGGDLQAAIIAQRAADVAAGLPACRSCGCTQNAACQPPCWWAEPTLCSACRGRGESS